MAHFIRCIDGHVFDAGTATVCPICGAVVEFTESVDPTSPGTPIADGTGVAASAMLRTPVLGAVAAGVLCVGIAALFFALRETRPATTSHPAAASLTAQQLGDPLQMALFVTRMLTAFDQKHYGDALSQAEALATNNNPVGMRVEARDSPGRSCRPERSGPGARPVDERHQPRRSEFGAVTRPFERARNRRPAKFE